MKRNMWILPLLMSVGVVAQAAAQGAPGKALYIVTDAGTGWQPLAINSSGMMTGQGSLGYAWTPAGGLVVVPGFDGVRKAVPWGVNDGGVVTGYAYTDQGYAAFLWDAVNGTQQLDTFDGNNSEARAINAHGDVVGDSVAPFLWKPGQGWTYLPLQGGGSGGTTDVNSSDQVLGGIIFDGNDEEVIWEPDGSVRFLGNMLDQYQNDANCINDLGYVCGYTFGPMGSIGYLLDPAGNYTPIYNPINKTYTTYANSMNNHNVVVGEAGLGGAPGGFMWSPTGGFTFLNSVLAKGSTPWNVIDALGINDRGQIAALATLNGVTHAVLLSPAPSLPPPRRTP